MAVPIPIGFARVVQPITNLLANTRNTVTYAVEWDSGAGTPTDWASAIDTKFRTAWVSATDSGFRFEGAEVQFGNDGPPVVAISTVPPVSGSRAGEVTPPNYACLIRKRTEFGGRAYRGRLFFPALVQDAEADESGRIATARVTALQTVATNWLTALNDPVGTPSPGWALRMFLLHNPPSAGGSPPAPTRVTALQVQSLGGTQRRRMR